MRYEYNYVILRYVHDTVSSEFVNVGVVLVSPKLRFYGAMCNPRYQRISQFFGGIPGEHYRQLASYVQDRVEELNEREIGHLDFGQLPKTAEDLIQQILPKDDSSFQFSTLRGGIADTDQMQDVLDELYLRFVGRFEQSMEHRARTDDEIWRSFKVAFDKRKISSHLRSYVLKARHYEYEFKRAYRNHRLHVYQPISFDLQGSQDIVEKAIQWFGRIEQLRENSEDFKPYFLLGEPSVADLRPAFQNAKDILSEVGGDKELISEKEVDNFSEQVRKEIFSSRS